MSEKTYGLSQKAMTEKYEDLLFTKVMAQYAEKESERILAEMEAQNAENIPKPDPAAIGRLYSKIERKENLSTLWRFSKKIITFAAMVVFVAFVSLSSVVVASAEAREAVAEAIYHLVLEEHEEYTRVSIGENTGFVDPEIYDWEGAFAPTYMPEGYSFENIMDLINQQIVSYRFGDNYINFKQAKGEGFSYQNTENAELTKTISIGESDGFLVVNDGVSTILWSMEDTLLCVSGTAPTDEIIKIAESIKPIGKTESEEPVEEYTFIDPENYNYKNAYAPTYMTDGFLLTDMSLSSDINQHTYTNQNKYIFIEQDIITAGSHIDTENAQVVKEIVINDSQALYVEKDGLAYVTWSFPDALLFVCGNVSGEEIIKVAEGLKPIGKTESEEPVEKYTFIDPEIYDWEGAFAPTYVPDNYNYSEKIDIGNEKIVIYSKGEREIIFSQSVETTVEKVDTENAELVEEIAIGESNGFYVVKNGITSIFWNCENTLLSVVGNADSHEILQMAQGIKPIN